eukprot:2842581-Alexandrium_andersonii.AAC.1
MPADALFCPTRTPPAVQAAVHPRRRAPSHGLCDRRGALPSCPLRERAVTDSQHAGMEHQGYQA